MSERIAIFPGSFDPFTTGHQQVVQQALPLFDSIIIAVGHSISKASLLTVEERLHALLETFAAEKKVTVQSFKGLIVDFAKAQKATYLIRGLRNSSDFDYELPMAHTNRALYPGLQTVFFATAPDLSFISSTLVREIATKGGDFKPFVPKSFHPLLGQRP